jgi:hypothetical protein
MAGLTRRGMVAALATLPAACAGPPAPPRAVHPDLARLDRLVAAYPDHLAGIEDAALVWHDGTRMPTGAGLPPRPMAAMLDDATIAEQMRQDYQPGPLAAPPPPGEDPGRLRNTAFFAKMYGECRDGAVRPRLRRVAWMPGFSAQGLMVTTVNDVAGRLERVIAALEALPPGLRAFLLPAAGTYNCRVIAGTNRPSMHGTGAAIDIATRRSDYWVWTLGRGGAEEATPDAALPAWRNRIPEEIVAAFEAERFIWGGKWSRFDTMHFEYRPELFPATVSA